MPQASPFRISNIIERSVNDALWGSITFLLVSKV